MASTSFTLGPHWDAFIRTKVDSGRFGSASEVVRAALRELEERDARFEELRRHVAEGAAQADRGEFVEDYDVEAILTRAKARA